MQDLQSVLANLINLPPAGLMPARGQSTQTPLPPESPLVAPNTHADAGAARMPASGRTEPLSSSELPSSSKGPKPTSSTGPEHSVPGCASAAQLARCLGQEDESAQPLQLEKPGAYVAVFFRQCGSTDASSSIEPTSISPWGHSIPSVAEARQLPQNVVICPPPDALPVADEAVTQAAALVQCLFPAQTALFDKKEGDGNSDVSDDEAMQAMQAAVDGINGHV